MRADSSSDYSSISSEYCLMSELGRTSGIDLVTDWFRVRFTSEDEDCLAECILLVEDSLFVS